MQRTSPFVPVAISIALAGPALVVAPSALALATAAADPPALPITRVVLYKHGIGYFEREGSVEGNASIPLRFKQAEMSDVLKSLTVLDRSGRPGNSIATIAYDSQKPASEILADFAFDLRQDNVQLAMLKQLRGARVSADVAGRGTVKGSVLGIDERSRNDGENVRRVPLLSLLGDSGEILAVELFDLQSLEFEDALLAADLQRYLATLRQTQRRDEKSVEVRCEGEGTRTIFASYAIEQPVWKATYRLVLFEGAPRPLLQGWAIVDNTSDEDWKDVDLSLVAGLPISFRHDLYTPRRKDRPWLVVNEQATASLAALGEMSKRVELEGELGLEDDDKSGGAAGKKVMRKAGRVHAGLAPAAPAPAEAAMSLEDSFDAQRAESVTREIGDLLEYRIDHKVTIPRNRSALLPIVKSDVEGEKIALYREAARPGNPLSALRVVNTSGVALEAGPLTVLEGATYAGEAFLDSLKPKELRYIPYAVELGIKAEAKIESTRERVHRVEIRQGVMRSRYDVKETKVYALTNRNLEARKVIVEHARRNGYRLLEPAKPFEQELDVYRFQIEVKPDETVRLPVVEALEQSDAWQVSTFDSDSVVTFETQGVLNDASRKFLKDVIGRKQELAVLQRDVAARQTALKDIESDQNRVRGNLRALRSSAEEKDLRKTYLDQMKKDEERIKSLRTELAALEEQVRSKQGEIDRLLAEFDLEYTVDGTSGR